MDEKYYKKKITLSIEQIKRLEDLKFNINIKT